MFSLLTMALSWLPIPFLSLNQVRSVAFFMIVVVVVDVVVVVVSGGGGGVVDVVVVVGGDVGEAVIFSTVNILN